MNTLENNIDYYSKFSVLNLLCLMILLGMPSVVSGNILFGFFFLALSSTVLIFEWFTHLKNKPEKVKKQFVIRIILAASLSFFLHVSGFLYVLIAISYQISWLLFIGTYLKPKNS